MSSDTVSIKNVYDEIHVYEYTYEIWCSADDWTRIYITIGSYFYCSFLITHFATRGPNKQEKSTWKQQKEEEKKYV